jgi:NitT/TauT family transport system substrate-binding protein
MTALTSRRQALTAFASTALALGVPRPARAADRVRFLTSWFAQGVHGGFYQAKATGIYAQHGLDVTIAMGGPQINGMQLLAGGDTDFAIGYDLAVLSAVQRGLPIVTVASGFQFDLQGIMTHADVTSLAALKGRRILLASSAHQAIWPWLKERYGYTDDQIGADTGNLQPFFADPTVAMQGYSTDEPFEAQQAHFPVNFFLLAKYGYPPYGSTVITTTALRASKPDVVRRFVRASMEGWRSYLRDPRPGNALIQIDNPRSTDDQNAFCVAELKRSGAVTGGDAARLGIGTMTDARWKATRDFCVRYGLLDARTDWKAAYTLDDVADLRILALTD